MGVDAFGEAERGVAGKPNAVAGPADASAIKDRAFDGDVDGMFIHYAGFGGHDASKASAFAVIGDAEIAFFQTIGLAVHRLPIAL